MYFKIKKEDMRNYESIVNKKISDSDFLGKPGEKRNVEVLRE
jgi:hypothetical protein